MIEIYQFAKSDRIAECMFEKVYFMWDSSLYKPDVKVNIVRRKLGIELAKSEPLSEKIKENREGYIIIPVPDTGIPAAEAMSKYLNIPSLTGLRKKKHIVKGKGFIQKQYQREFIMRHKYDVINYVTEGKKIILVDDSIVRGDTSKIIGKMLREIGKAEEIHLRSTCPPIKFPCFYGIDFPTVKELIASKFSGIEEVEREVAKINGFDSVHYQSIEGLLNALGMKEEECCLACLNGNYPTPAGKKRLEEALAEAFIEK